MRRVAGRAIDLLILGSLLLCAAVAVLWVWSESSAVYVYFTRTVDPGPSELNVDETSVGFLVRRGVIQCDWLRHGTLHGSAPFADDWERHEADAWDWGCVDLDSLFADGDLADTAGMGRGGIGSREPTLRWGSFGIGQYVYRGTGLISRRVPNGLCTSAFLPAWFVVAITALPPVWRGGACLGCAIRRRRAVRRQLCVGCGYDLRASKHRCPECGKAMPEHGAP